MVAATVPDSVQVLTEIKGGSRGAYLMSGVAYHAPMSGFELYGSNKVRLNLPSAGAVYRDGHVPK